MHIRRLGGGNGHCPAVPYCSCLKNQKIYYEEKEVHAKSPRLFVPNEPKYKK